MWNKTILELKIAKTIIHVQTVLSDNENKKKIKN